MMDKRLKHYQDKLAYETDSWDLKVALEDTEDIIVIDARSPKAYEADSIMPAWGR